MQTLRIFCVFIAAVVSFLTAESHAQDTTAHPAMTKEQIANLVSRVRDAPTEEFLLASIGEPDAHRFRVVFVYNSKRFTFDHNCWVKGIQVWIRPDGTYHPNPVANAIADSNADGVVDFGTDGNVRIFATAGHSHEGSPAEGEEHRTHWQRAYNEALAGLEATLNRNHLY